MEYVGYMMGIIAFAWCASLSAEVIKMKRMLKEYEGASSDKSSLRDIIQKNLGKQGKFTFESNEGDTDIASKYCTLQDIDEDWLFLRIEKSGIEKLIRIESIKSIQFK